MPCPVALGQAAGSLTGQSQAGIQERDIVSDRVPAHDDVGCFELVSCCHAELRVIDDALALVGPAVAPSSLMSVSQPASRHSFSGSSPSKVSFVSHHPQTHSIVSGSGSLYWCK